MKLAALLSICLALPAFAADKPNRSPAATKTFKLTDVMDKVGHNRYVHITYGVGDNGVTYTKVVSSTEDLLVRESKDSNALLVVEAMCKHGTVVPVVTSPGETATYYCFTN